MKTKSIAFFLLPIAWVTAGASAQTVQTPTPAPVVSSALVPSQTVYSQRLPSANELTNIAAAQGLTVERIEQSASQVTAVYRNANGQTNTVAYLLMPSSSGATAGVAAPGAPAPLVVYQPAPRVVYYDGYGPTYYDSYPGYWYPPVSLSLGFGFRGGGFHGGGFRGGFHHWR